MRFLGVSLLVCLVAMAGCTVPCKNNLPPADRLMAPGPGVGGPGPGVMMYPPGGMIPGMTSQFNFVGPDGMHVNWDVSAPGAFDSEVFVCPFKYNFPQGAIYRLKLTNIPGRPGAELYPTLEVGPMMPRTEAFLAHNAIPVQFTPEDFDQVLTGNFVTKVLYLPDPAFQELAVAGVETLVSTRLDPGVDPIIEADRQGAILAIVRLGNKDLQGGNGAVRDGAVTPTSYQEGDEGQPVAAGAPLGAPICGPSSVPGNYIAGVTAPQWGMPMCGTPIGLPGPPHVPFGSPAGLQKHTIVNHTPMHMPRASDHVRVDVKQEPGFSYPKPADRATIVERTRKGPGHFFQPLLDKLEVIRPGHRAASADPACATPCQTTVEE